MEIRQVNETQYLETMGSKMTDITKTAEPLVYIWDYASHLFKNNMLMEYGFEKRLIEAVYVNSDNTYQHVLLFAKKDNCFIVIIVDIIYKIIFGYYILDLNEKYGLNEKGAKK